MFKLFSKKPTPPPVGDWKMFDEFALFCAEQALQVMREAGHEPDQRCVHAVEVLRRWVAGEAVELELAAACKAVLSITTEIKDTRDAHMEKVKANQVTLSALEEAEKLLGEERREPEHDVEESLRLRMTAWGRICSPNGAWPRTGGIVRPKIVREAREAIARAVVKVQNSLKRDEVAGRPFFATREITACLANCIASSVDVCEDLGEGIGVNAEEAALQAKYVGMDAGLPDGYLLKLQDQELARIGEGLSWPDAPIISVQFAQRLEKTRGDRGDSLT